MQPSQGLGFGVEGWTIKGLGFRVQRKQMLDHQRKQMLDHDQRKQVLQEAAGVGRWRGRAVR